MCRHIYFINNNHVIGVVIEIDNANPGIGNAVLPTSFLREINNK